MCAYKPILPKILCCTGVYSVMCCDDRIYKSESCVRLVLDAICVRNEDTLGMEYVRRMVLLAALGEKKDKLKKKCVQQRGKKDELIKYLFNSEERPCAKQLLLRRKMRVPDSDWEKQCQMYNIHVLPHRLLNCANDALKENCAYPR